MQSDGEMLSGSTVAPLRQIKMSARTLGAHGVSTDSNRNLGREGHQQSRDAPESSIKTQILLNNNQTQKNQTDI